MKIGDKVIVRSFSLGVNHRIRPGGIGFINNVRFYESRFEINVKFVDSTDPYGSWDTWWFLETDLKITREKTSIELDQINYLKSIKRSPVQELILYNLEEI